VHTRVLMRLRSGQLPRGPTDVYDIAESQGWLRGKSGESRERREAGGTLIASLTTVRLSLYTLPVLHYLPKAWPLRADYSKSFVHCTTLPVCLCISPKCPMCPELPELPGLLSG
jgi:hypothetical protein